MGIKIGQQLLKTTVFLTNCERISRKTSSSCARIGVWIAREGKRGR